MKQKEEHMFVKDSEHCKHCKYKVGVITYDGALTPVCNYCYTTYKRRGCSVEDCMIWKRTDVLKGEVK